MVAFEGDYLWGNRTGVGSHCIFFLSDLGQGFFRPAGILFVEFYFGALRVLCLVNV